MPKIKTHSGAKKRFRLKKSGLIKRNCAYTSHILTKKSQKRKRKLRKGRYVFHGEVKIISRLLGH